MSGIPVGVINLLGPGERGAVGGAGGSGGSNGKADGGGSARHFRGRQQVSPCITLTRADLVRRHCRRRNWRGAGTEKRDSRRAEEQRRGPNRAVKAGVGRQITPKEAPARALYNTGRGAASVAFDQSPIQWSERVGVEKMGNARQQSRQDSVTRARRKQPKPGR